MCKEMTLNGTLSLSCPDGFHVMNEEERASLKLLGKGPGEVLADPERHILLSIGWKPIGGLTALLLSSKDAFRGMRPQLLKALKPFFCKETGRLSALIGGEKAEGLSYEYESGGIGMSGRSYVVKHGKAFYFLHFYVRTALQEESLPVCDGILESVSWV